MRHSDTRFRILLIGPALFLALGWTAASAQTTRDPAERLLQMMSADAQIGVSVRDVEPDMPEGALITQVVAGMPAARAGVKQGDVVVEYDRERVRSRSQLVRLIRETPEGRKVPMVVMRDGKRVELSVTPQASDSRSFQYELPWQFREGSLQPPVSPRVIPEPPSNSWRFDVPPTPRRPLLPGNPRVGIGVTELTPQLAEYFGTKEGVLISTVDDGSPASRAGLKAGDIITSVDGRTVARVDDVSQAMRSKRSGDQVAIGITRNHKAQVINVTLGDLRPGQPI